MYSHEPRKVRHIAVNMNIELNAHFVKWSSLVLMQYSTPLNKPCAPKSHRAIDSWRFSGHEEETSFGFQNCIILLRRLPFRSFSFFSGKVGARCSIDNLLFSP